MSTTKSLKVSVSNYPPGRGSGMDLRCSVLLLEPDLERCLLFSRGICGSATQFAVTDSAAVRLNDLIEAVGVSSSSMLALRAFISFT